MSMLEQQMAARRARLLEAARELIEVGGYSGLTMRDLARAGGVTVPTIYNLIGNKEQVLLAAVEEQTEGFVAALERAHGDLLDVVEATVRQLVRRPRYYRALLLALAGAERTGAAKRYAASALGEQIERALGDLDEAGELAAWVDRGVLAERLHDHIDHAAIEWARGSLTAPAFRAAALLDASLTMLGVTEGEARRRFARAAAEAQERAGRGGRRLRGRAA